MKNQDIFDAHMIGDGSLLYRHKTDKNPSFTVTNKHSNYLKWISNFLDVLSDRPVWNRSYYDLRTNKTYICHHIVALQCEEFLNEYKRWYSNNGQKDIPLDINVSKEFLLHWYLDDGSLGSSGGVYFAVDSYSKERIINLQSKLEILTGFKIGIHRNGKGFRLYLSKKYSQAFFEFIGPCPVKEYEYKWR
jgi:LAGLIDADG DNA endonuclease family